jgi:Holliday junction resolvase
MKQTEAELTSAIRSLLKTVGVFAWKNWSGPMTHPKGIADILGCWQGRFVAIEVKAAGGRVSQDQEKFIETVKRHGGIAFVARSIDDVVLGLGIQDRFLFPAGRITSQPAKAQAQG